MTRLQKATTILALALCLAGAIAGELWDASHSPHAPSQQAAADKKDTASHKTIEERHEDAEEAIATYTLWLMAFTAVLAVATIALGIGTFFQIKLARSEFLANNRPILRVRYFKRTDGDKDTEIDIRFSVVNVGKSAARLLGSSVQIGWFQEGGLPVPIYLNGNDVTGQRKFEVGASDEYIFRQGRSGGPRFVPLHFYGYLVYSDDMGNTRTTAFCRRWLASAGRFIKVEDPDYEYED